MIQNEQVSRLQRYLEERLQSPDPNVKAAAAAALSRLRQYSKGAGLEEGARGYISPDELSDLTLGDDQSVYYTRDELDAMDEDYRRQEQDDIRRGAIQDDGRLFGAGIRSLGTIDVKPHVIVGNDGRQYGGVELGRYIDNMLSSEPDAQGEFSGRSTNTVARSHWTLDQREMPKTTRGNQNYVVGEFTGPRNYDDVEFNRFRRNLIAKGKQTPRYDGGQHYVVVRNEGPNEEQAGFYLVNLDQTPDSAGDFANQDLYPYKGQVLYDRETRSSWDAADKAARKFSPYELGELGKIRARKHWQKLKTDKNGRIILPDGSSLPSMIDYASTGHTNMPLLNDEGIKFDGVEGINPVTGELYKRSPTQYIDYRLENMNRKKAEAEAAGAGTSTGTPAMLTRSYSRGGRLRVPKRNSYGDRVSRADNLGTDEYDVYF